MNYNFSNNLNSVQFLGLKPDNKSVQSQLFLQSIILVKNSHFNSFEKILTPLRNRMETSTEFDKSSKSKSNFSWISFIRKLTEL